MPRRNNGFNLEDNLVLHQWMLGLFGYKDFDHLADQLKDARLEGVTEDNISRFHSVLRALLPQKSPLTADILLAYDENILRHWTRITERRNRTGQRLQLKYFQYLALLFTEIYLDNYFRDPDGLLKTLNEQVISFNKSKRIEERLSLYTAQQLNKLAFWQATGSGKTLIMHVNLLQFWHYQHRYNRQRDINRVILLTPNEGLSQQHLEEFQLSGITAEIFDKETRSMFTGQTIEIIDIHKLRDEMGEKTVAVDAFETNNLVFVDEGHRGSSGIEWKSRRDRLCESGFSFEYSATFGQAMKAANKPELTQEYARCIIMDYSYKFFYRDGYGKDYHILNLENDEQEESRQLYLTACLLMFYQQMRIYHDNRIDFRPYLIERPLWVFVGGSVNAVYQRKGRKLSDVADVVLFLAEFIHNRRLAENRIQKLLTASTELRDSRGNEIFTNAFTYIGSQSAEALYDDILQTVFNASSPGAIHVEDLKGVEGELGLSIGENSYFAVINVGDTTKLRNLLSEQEELVVRQKEFTKSLFDNLNDPNSPINLLIGSKKFTEGWNSWRVSTMGLMNVGRGEGSEIIQLFGRGVRLKGYEFGLKRSRRLDGVDTPENIEELETLNIFGVRANYMRQFKEYLEEEGLPANEQRIEFVLPVIKNLGQQKLRIVRVKSDVDFKRDGEKPALGLPPQHLTRYPVTVDWYPKIQATSSQGITIDSGSGSKHEAKLGVEQLAFIDLEALYFELLQFKNERGWNNLYIPSGIVEQLLDPVNSANWYRLFIPPQELQFRDFNQIRVWQDIALTLLKKYCDKYYKHRQSEFESPHLEYQDLLPDDPNFIDEYRFLIEESEKDIINRLRELRQQIEDGEFKGVADVGSIFRAIKFGNHLYEPLIYLKSRHVEITPVALNEGERDFVMHLRAYFEERTSFFANKELYLLRNLSRGKGIGFFEAGNFYPDFILWLLVDGKQYVTFVDPKGIRNLRGFDDDKVQFYQTIKDLEQRLADENVILNSFIISNTPFEQVDWWEEDAKRTDFESRNVLFQAQDRQYIAQMVSKILSE